MQVAAAFGTGLLFGLGLILAGMSNPAKVQGFLVSDYAPRWGSALAEMAGWVRSGQIKYREDIVEGFENLPKAFIGLLKGENTGKRIVKV